MCNSAYFSNVAANARVTQHQVIRIHNTDSLIAAFENTKQIFLLLNQ